MACCRPIHLEPDHKVQFKIHKYSFWNRFPQGIDVPCGCCLNCRVDRRNLWSDRAKWEYKNKLTGAFCTFTYDDIYIKDITHRSPSTGDLVATLDYGHLHKFIDRIRKRVKYFYETHPNIEPNPLMRPDFSYIAVGEYGERGQVFDRPHYHILFFGLDFAYCKKMFKETWRMGLIDVLPILDGGINYVLKYMDKALKGALAEYTYDRHCIARPAMRTSKSFGSDLFFDRKEEIISHDFTYQVGRVRRPVPSYWIKQLIGTSSYENDPRLLEKRRRSMARLRENMEKNYNLKYSRRSAESFKASQAQIRERKLRQDLLNDGVGVIDYTAFDRGSYLVYERTKILELMDTNITALHSSQINYLSQLARVYDSDLEELTPQELERHIGYTLSLASQDLPPF